MQKDSINVFFRTGCLVFSLWIMTVVVSRINAVTLAAHQIQLQVWLFASFVMDGFAVTATSICGKSFGQNNFQEFKAIAKKFLRMSYIVGLCYSIVCFLGFRFMINLFTHDSQIHDAIVEPWFLMACFQVFGAGVYLYDGLLYAQGNFKFMRKRMMEGCFLIFVPLLYFFQNNFQGIWFAFACLILYRFFTAHFYFQKYWK